MMQYLWPLIAVLVGYGIAVFVKPNNKRFLKLLLAFSGSFLLSLTVMHLLPEVFGSAETRIPIGLFIMAGILLQIILEYFSQGAEHGHVHVQGKISQIPWSLFVSLCLHAFLEGFPVSDHHDLAIGIAVHHFPIAIILTLFLTNANLSAFKVFGFMATFAIMTPLGTLVSASVPPLASYHREITAVVIGILFHISSTIIFESSENHRFNLAKISMIIAGILIALFL